VCVQFADIAKNTMYVPPREIVFSHVLELQSA
jgi:hypothetical protein